MTGSSSSEKVDRLSNLPEEILLLVFSFLEPRDVALLGCVSKGLLRCSRDDTSWKKRCFFDSGFVEKMAERELLLTRNPFVVGGAAPASDATAATKQGSVNSTVTRRFPQLLANWDPTFPGEPVSWYDEYVQRHADVVVNWCQRVERRDYTLRSDDLDSGIDTEMETEEVSAVALYHPRDGSGLLAVTPLADGAVCLFDVTGGGRTKKGGILSRSSGRILQPDNPPGYGGGKLAWSSGSSAIETLVPLFNPWGYSEVISVDSTSDRAYIGTLRGFAEVDLGSLRVVRRHQSPCPITAISSADPTVPLTVGSRDGIRLYDHRDPELLSRGLNDADHHGAVSARPANAGLASPFIHSAWWQLEPFKVSMPSSRGALSILHMPESAIPEPRSGLGVSNDIFVAGRGAAIIYYDRRKFPAVAGCLHSGASLSGLAAIPYPFSTLDWELRRSGDLPLEALAAGKSHPGRRTLVACGEYRGRGSLELYGLLPRDTTPHTVARKGTAGAGESQQPPQNAVFKNRQNASRAKLFSIANHGTRLVASDAAGAVSWFERDGWTEVRRVQLADGVDGAEDGPWARKLLDVGSRQPGCRGDLLFWTGQKLGMLTFSAPGNAFDAGDFEEEPVSADGGGTRFEEQSRLEQQAREYRERMGFALERHFDDIRTVRDLGYFGFR